MSKHFSFLWYYLDVLALGDTKIPNSNINFGKVPNFVTVDTIISLVQSLFKVTLVDTI